MKWERNDNRTGWTVEAPLALKLWLQEREEVRKVCPCLCVCPSDSGGGGASSLSMCLNLQQLEAASQVSSCRIKLPIFYRCCWSSTPTELRDKRKGKHENREEKKQKQKESHTTDVLGSSLWFTRRSFSYTMLPLSLSVCVCVGMCQEVRLPLRTYFRQIWNVGNIRSFRCEAGISVGQAVVMARLNLMEMNGTLCSLPKSNLRNLCVKKTNSAPCILD